jgi:hypothetical protein
MISNRASPECWRLSCDAQPTDHWLPTCFTKMKMISLYQSDRIVAADPILRSAIIQAMAECQLKRKYAPTATKVAAYLSVNGWFTQQLVICGAGFGGMSERDYSAIAAKDALQILRHVKIVPTGIRSLWFAHRTIVPFIKSLTINWLMRKWNE